MNYPYWYLVSIRISVFQKGLHNEIKLFEKLLITSFFSHWIFNFWFKHFEYQPRYFLNYFWNNCFKKLETIQLKPNYHGSHHFYIIKLLKKQPEMIFIDQWKKKKGSLRKQVKWKSRQKVPSFKIIFHDLLEIKTLEIDYDTWWWISLID